MEIVFNGIKFGVVLAFLIGPVFFTIIQTSIERGFWKGALVALGVSVSDVINGISPMVLIFWVATLSMATVEMGYSGGFELVIFFIALLFTVLATDLIKAYLADKLRSLITHRFLIIMNVLVGVFLIIFGIQLLLKAKTAFNMLH
ncbi:MAG: LysE family transporter [Bacteroidetes bacterium]|nr:LysE family transporter [Bacteroidota bacterium]